jgi:hypothetical protein
MDGQILSVAIGGRKLNKLKTYIYFCICDALMNPMKEISVRNEGSECWERSGIRSQESESEGCRSNPIVDLKSSRIMI